MNGASSNHAGVNPSPATSQKEPSNIHTLTALTSPPTFSQSPQPPFNPPLPQKKSAWSYQSSKHTPFLGLNVSAPEPISTPVHVPLERSKTIPSRSIVPYTYNSDSTGSSVGAIYGGGQKDERRSGSKAGRSRSAERKKVEEDEDVKMVSISKVRRVVSTVDVSMRSQSRAAHQETPSKPKSFKETIKSLVRPTTDSEKKAITKAYMRREEDPKSRKAREKRERREAREFAMERVAGDKERGLRNGRGSGGGGGGREMRLGVEPPAVGMMGDSNRQTDPSLLPSPQGSPAPDLRSILNAPQQLSVRVGLPQNPPHFRWPYRAPPTNSVLHDILASTNTPYVTGVAEGGRDYRAVHSPMWGTKGSVMKGKELLTPKMLVPTSASGSGFDGGVLHVAMPDQDASGFGKSISTVDDDDDEEEYEDDDEGYLNIPWLVLSGSVLRLKYSKNIIDGEELDIPQSYEITSTHPVGDIQHAGVLPLLTGTTIRVWFSSVWDCIARSASPGGLLTMMVQDHELLLTIRDIALAFPQSHMPLRILTVGELGATLDDIRVELESILRWSAQFDSQPTHSHVHLPALLLLLAADNDQLLSDMATQNLMTGELLTETERKHRLRRIALAHVGASSGSHLAHFPASYSRLEILLTANDEDIIETSVEQYRLRFEQATVRDRALQPEMREKLGIL